MNKFIKMSQVMLLMLAMGAAHAQISSVTNVITPSAPTDWSSKNSNDVVTINNGTGNLLTITITVTKPATSQPNPAGVNINNCGDTKHIDAGSTAICTTNDSNNPVNFSSDSQTDAASGTYVIAQNPA
ncbi:hypothetical protein AQUSIP_02490 [Aquicella siphonis]|uniref:Uncharacterized protein n=1 Tax=Aquicella siphonis TaxID=254247 RepID=A0A5E4PEE7_9COXI|nr:hypothetical protein [Aquicella siphonis]VVC74975.1 hypothetical protein AQUSIP_02490 [Aquicella siphonis]